MLYFYRSCKHKTAIFHQTIFNLSQLTYFWRWSTMFSWIDSHTARGHSYMHKHCPTVRLCGLRNTCTVIQQHFFNSLDIYLYRQSISFNSSDVQTSYTVSLFVNVHISFSGHYFLISSEVCWAVLRFVLKVPSRVPRKDVNYLSGPRSMTE